MSDSSSQLASMQSFLTASLMALTWMSRMRAPSCPGSSWRRTPSRAWPSRLGVAVQRRLAVGARHPHELLGPERLPVELEHLGAVANGDRAVDAVETIRNLLGHITSLPGIAEKTARSHAPISSGIESCS